MLRGATFLVSAPRRVLFLEKEPKSRELGSRSIAGWIIRYDA